VKIGIIGGGAIGSYYAGLLRRAGTDVRLVTRGDHLAAIRQRGLQIRTPNEEFVIQLDATDDLFSTGDCDFVILAVKGYSLAQVAPGVAAAAKQGATIAPLLNGVDVAERLESLGVPKASIIGGLATVSVFRIAPGVIERRSPFDRVVLGELDRVQRDRAPRVVGALSAAGSAARLSDDMPLDLWRKFSLIVPMTVACGLSRRPVGYTLDTELGRALITGSLIEIVAVSREIGAALGDDDAARLRDDLLGLPFETRPSFLADLERGGPTELDLLAGAVSRLGRQVNVPTPIHDVATAAFDAATRDRAESPPPGQRR
jgi:2-dehydropantoate 2-reductase